MRNFVFAIVTLLPAIGCSTSSTSATTSGSDHEAVLKEMIASQTAIAEALESITDEASGKTAVPKIEKAGQELLAAKKRADALGNPTGDEKERLKNTFGPKLIESQKRLVAGAPNKLKASGEDAKAIDRALAPFARVE